MTHDDALEALEHGPLHPLRDIHDDLTTKYKAGIYTLWLDGQFLYTGISYRADLPTDERDGKWGVWGRLKTHHHAASKELAREIMARFVIPELTDDERDALRTRGYEMLRPKLQALLDKLEYRVWITETGADARALERAVRSEGLRHAGRPLLNPR